MRPGVQRVWTGRQKDGVWVAINAAHIVGVVETDDALVIMVSTGGRLELPLTPLPDVGAMAVDPEQFAAWMQGHADPRETFAWPKESS